MKYERPHVAGLHVADEERYVEVEGDKPKVDPTRQHFAALIAGLRVAEDYARQEHLALLRVGEAARELIEAEQGALTPPMRKLQRALIYAGFIET